MQPYLFPYLGYFQLVQAVDRFVIYDDVTYIKQGWVNRNQIRVNGQPYLFTLPLHAASSNTLICDLELDRGKFGAWRTKFLRTIAQAYARAPYVHATLGVIDEVLDGQATQLTEVLANGIRTVLEHCGCTTDLVLTSRKYRNSSLTGQDRIIDICLQERARMYINAPGGRHLYDRSSFAAHGLELRFLRPGLSSYAQGKQEFLSGLSMIDVLMYNAPEQLHSLINTFEIDE